MILIQVCNFHWLSICPMLKRRKIYSSSAIQLPPCLMLPRNPFSPVNSVWPHLLMHNCHLPGQPVICISPWPIFCPCPGIMILSSWPQQRRTKPDLTCQEPLIYKWDPTQALEKHICLIQHTSSFLCWLPEKIKRLSCCKKRLIKLLPELALLALSLLQKNLSLKEPIFIHPICSQWLQRAEN